MEAGQHVPSLGHYLAPIFQTTCGDARHLAIALSGGSDSMALALLMQAWCAQHQRTLVTLTVDHGLREGSASEAEQVAQWMHQRGMAHHILTPAPLPITNLQTRAREMRYGALTQWCRAHGMDTLVLAHHADDQAETVALQQHRGEDGPSRSGMALVSMRGALRLVRPLLGVRKATLLDYLRTHDQPWVEDPTNHSDAYARNRLRRTLDDATVQVLWHDAQRHGRQRHADDLARNAWLARHAHASDAHLTLHATVWRSLPALQRTDILSRAIRAMGVKRFRPRFHETARLDARIMQHTNGKATLGHCLIIWSADAITLAPEPLESEVNPPHITGHDALKQLGNMPFWWFNDAPFFNGATLASHL